MKVLKYEAHNVLGIKDIVWDMEGSHLWLVGGENGQGKTSANTALICALAGKRGMDNYPEVLLRDGERSGSVRIELTGVEELHEDERITVELNLRRKPSGTVVEEFRVLDSTGEEAPEPRTLLRRLFQLRAFDPLAFCRMKPSEQSKVMHDLLGLDLEKYDQDRQETYDKRRQVGLDGKAWKGKFDAIPEVKDAPEHEVSMTDLMDKMSSLQYDQSERQVIQTMASGVEEKLADQKNKIKQLEDEARKLEAEIYSAKEKKKSLSKKHGELLKQMDEMPNFENEIEGVRKQITEADSLNKKFRDAQARAEAERQLKEHRELYQLMTDRIAEIDKEKATEIANADWPVPGMEFTEDGVLLDGLPFAQASTSQRIMASVKVGMALNPTLRLMVCSNGSELGCDTLDELERILKENDFQMCVELVCRSKEDRDRCAVIISNGTVN